ncbi:MAG: 16S rRNA processing protein RimM [Anaerolineae bacterium]|nr:16S rRNA processing protein RimM [Anaerolineae bacterium]
MPKRRPEPKYLAIAQIVAPHGIRGEVRAVILTDFPERFALLETVYLGEEGRAVRLEGYRFHRGQVLLKLEGCDTRSQAEELRQVLVQVPVSEAMPLPEGTYYVHQIVGLEAWTEEGQFLGEVTEVLETGANDVYVLQGGPYGEILVPALESVVLEIDLEEGRMLVRLPPGLRPGED